VWSWDNTEPFGDSVASENPSGLGAFTCNLRFPGTYADKETATLYNWHRNLDPARGQYLQAEPLGLFGDINLYRYARNNSLSIMDPDGMQAVMGGGAASGSTAGGLGGLGRPGGILSRPKKPEDPLTEALNPRVRSGSGAISASQDCPPDDECDRKFQQDNALCEAIAGPRYGGRGLALCRSAAVTRLGECRRFGVGGIKTPLHGVDTPL
jgi:RHS repeat-associated protein